MISTFSSTPLLANNASCCAKAQLLRSLPLLKSAAPTPSMLPLTSVPCSFVPKQTKSTTSIGTSTITMSVLNSMAKLATPSTLPIQCLWEVLPTTGALTQVILPAPTSIFLAPPSLTLPLPSAPLSRSITSLSSPVTKLL